MIFFGCLVSFCIAAWDNDKPGDNQVWNTAAGSIRDNWDAIEIELGIDLNDAHPYYQATDPQTKPDRSTAFDVNDLGRLWVDSDDNRLRVLTAFAGPTWSVTQAANLIQTSNPTFTLQNTDEEDTNGGRQSQFIAKGEQSGGEISTLGFLEFSHDGAADDQKGKFRIVLNDGDDDNAPSKTAITFSSTGLIDVANSLSVLDEDNLVSDGDTVLATQQSIKAYIDAQIATVVLGVWNDRDDDGSGDAVIKDTVYQAATDGFVMAYMNTNAIIEGLTDSSTPPTTIRVKDNGGQNTAGQWSSITFPVKSGDYWKVTNANNVFWMPFGP